MRHSILKGTTFGVTSGTITTLGLIVGLNSGTGSRLVVIGGILTIAIADAFSDALGIHVSEESECKHTPKEIWVATIATFLAKFLFALTFLVPVLIFPLQTAVIVSILWGIFAIAAMSYFIALEQKVKPWKVIGEHMLITVIVVIVTHLAGQWISGAFG